MEKPTKLDPVGEERQSEKENDVDARTSDCAVDVPAHHARRPPNGFLLFCKRHRDIVSEKNPTLENRGVTKLLGNWWRMLEETEREQYKDLARMNKEVFIANNPQFTWYKLPAPPLRTLVTRPSNRRAPKLEPTSITTAGPITPGKLADESQLGGITSLMSSSQSPPSTPQSTTPPSPLPSPTSSVPSPTAPPKKRFLLQSKAKAKSKEENDKKKHKKLNKRNLIRSKDSVESPTSPPGEENNCTNQQLIEKIVDASFEPKQQVNAQRHLDYINNEHTYQMNPYRMWNKQPVDEEEEENTICPNVNNNTIMLGMNDIKEENFLFDKCKTEDDIPDEEDDDDTKGIDGVLDCDKRGLEEDFADQTKPCQLQATQDNSIMGCDTDMNLQNMLGKVSRDIEYMMSEEKYSDDTSCSDMSYEEEEEEDDYDDDYEDRECWNGRRSDRSCKGRLYEEFIRGSVRKKQNKNRLDEDDNKHESHKSTKLNNYRTSPKNTHPDEGSDVEFKLNETPAKASEIIQMKLDLESKLQKEADEDVKVGRRRQLIRMNKKKPVSKVQLIKEKRELQASDFNLNEKIEKLPILSFDHFLQKKRQRKKRLLGGLEHRPMKKDNKQNHHHHHHHHHHRTITKNKLERFKHREMNGRHSYIRSYNETNNNNTTGIGSEKHMVTYQVHNSNTQRPDFADLTTLADTALSLLALGQAR